VIIKISVCGGGCSSSFRQCGGGGGSSSRSAAASATTVSIPISNKTCTFPSCSNLACHCGVGKSGYHSPCSVDCVLYCLFLINLLFIGFIRQIHVNSGGTRRSSGTQNLFLTIHLPIINYEQRIIIIIGAQKALNSVDLAVAYTISTTCQKSFKRSLHDQRFSLLLGPVWTYVFLNCDLLLCQGRTLLTFLKLYHVIIIWPIINT